MITKLTIVGLVFPKTISTFQRAYLNAVQTVPPYIMTTTRHDHHPIPTDDDVSDETEPNFVIGQFTILAPN